MQKNKKNILHLVNYSISLIGLLFFILKTFFKTQGEWGVEDHIVTAYVQKLHLLTTPILVFFVGSIFFDHIFLKLSKFSNEIRTSGVLLCLSFVIMIFSGVAIQVLYDEASRENASIVHNVATIVWLFSYLIHHFMGIKYSTFKFFKK